MPRNLRQAAVQMLGWKQFTPSKDVRMCNVLRYYALICWKGQKKLLNFSRAPKRDLRAQNKIREIENKTMSSGECERKKWRELNQIKNRREKFSNCQFLWEKLDVINHLFRPHTSLSIVVVVVCCCCSSASFLSFPFLPSPFVVAWQKSPTLFLFLQSSRSKISKKKVCRQTIGTRT